MWTAMTGTEVSFGEFGVALLGEVFTPEYLQVKLDAALDSVPRVPGFPGYVSSLRAGVPTLIADDGFERRFAVTVHGRLTVEFWPRSLGAGFDASMEIDLTVRVRTFRPTIVRLDIDLVTPDDLRVEVQGRGDLLPGLLEAGGAGVGRSSKHWLPMVALALNGALEASASRRQVDVLAGRARRNETGTRRAVAAGGRIGFAEFGDALIRRAVDRDTVIREVDDSVDSDAQVVLDSPMLLRGVVSAKLADVTSMAAEADELKYSLAIDIVVELHLGPGANATVMATTLRANVPMRVSATVEPATLHLRFEPVPFAELQIVEPVRRTGGRRMPLPRAKLSELIPRRVADELNARLARADRRIVISDLA
jgi:hypothetical protein